MSPRLEVIITSGWDFEGKGKKGYWIAPIYYLRRDYCFRNWGSRFLGENQLGFLGWRVVVIRRLADQGLEDWRVPRCKDPAVRVSGRASL